MESRVRVTDNSGVKWIKCIAIQQSVRKSLNNAYGYTFSIINSNNSIAKQNLNNLNSKSKKGPKVVQDPSKITNLQKGNVITGILVRTKTKQIRFNGLSTQFFENAAVLLKKNTKDQYELIGSRILGPIQQSILNDNKLFSTVQHIGSLSLKSSQLC